MMKAMWWMIVYVEAVLIAMGVTSDIKSRRIVAACVCAAFLSGMGGYRALMEPKPRRAVPEPKGS